MHEQSLSFLKSILTTPSPSGFEHGVAELYRKYVEPFAHRVTTDVMGNVTAIINPDAETRCRFPFNSANPTSTISVCCRRT